MELKDIKGIGEKKIALLWNQENITKTQDNSVKVEKQID